MRKGGAKAVKSAKEAQGLSKKLQDKSLFASTVYALAEGQAILGKYDEAAKEAKEAAKLFSEIEEKRAEAAAICLVAEVYQTQGNTMKAIDSANNAMALA